MKILLVIYICKGKKCGHEKGRHSHRAIINPLPPAVSNGMIIELIVYVIILDIIMTEIKTIHDAIIGKKRAQNFGPNSNIIARGLFQTKSDHSIKLFEEEFEIDHYVVGEGPSLFTIEECNILKDKINTKDESAVVSFLYKKIKSLLDDSLRDRMLIVANTEVDPYLPADNNNKTPDLLVAGRYVYKQGELELSGGVLFKGPRDTLFYDSLNIGDVKLSITNADVIEKGNYLLCLNKYYPLEKFLLTLYDREEFQVIILDEQKFISREKMRYSDPGSLKFFTDKCLSVNSVWHNSIVALCNFFDCVPLYLLGNGKTSRVNGVKRKGVEYALKIVTITSYFGVIQLEHETMKKIIDDGSKHVPSTISLLRMIQEEKKTIALGYLIYPIGNSVNSIPPCNYDSIFQSLYYLHRRGFLHGDPRINNVLILKNCHDHVNDYKSYFWIDFVGSKSASAQFKIDTDIFLKSFFNQDDPKILFDFYNEYSVFLKDDNFREVSKLVFDHAKKWHY